MEKDDQPSLEALESKIRAARAEQQGLESKKEGPAEPNPASQAFRVGIELVAGVLVGATLGYFLDRWLDTKPVFFLICFFFGTLGGGMNVYKMFKAEENNSEGAVDRSSNKDD